MFSFLNLLKPIQTFRLNKKYLSGAVRKEETIIKIRNAEKIHGATIIEIKPKMIEFICCCGRKDEKNITGFCHKGKCRWCSFEEYSIKYRKYSYDEILKDCDNKNRKLITTTEEYDKKSSKIIYECSCGEVITSDTMNSMKSIGCKYCKGKITKHPLQYTYEYVKKYIEDNGYILVDDFYINCDTSLNLVCPNGHTFEMDFYHFKKRNQRCHQCWKEQDHSRENSATWKGGLVSEISRERKSKRYNLWRDSIYSRDNYTCVCCHKRGVPICAHHINSFARFQDMRYDLDNGVTLCENCHSPYSENGFHKIYGTVSFTEDDFYEFLKLYSIDKQEM